MKKILISSLFSVAVLGLWAQPTPAPAQKSAMAVTNVTAHLGDGKVIKNAFVAFENGKITTVADATTIRIDKAKYGEVIEGGGKHLYPGFIAPDTKLGLSEIESVRAHNDYAEVGEFNPSVRSIIAYNTDSHVSPTVRSNGVLLAQIVPEGGRISGSSSVVELDGWNYEDAAYALDGGIHLRFPSVYSFSFDLVSGFSQKKNENFIKQVQEIDQFFAQAKAYTQSPQAPAVKNLKFEAMRGLFSKQKTLFLHANLVKEITEGVVLAKKHDFRVVVVGGADSWQITDFLKKNDVAIILGETHALPVRNDDDFDQPYKTPAMLKAAGILFCLSGIDGGYQTRNLPFMAGQAAGYGLDPEAAVSAITLSAAQILGVSKTVGSIELGKDATFILTDGDALDYRTSVVRRAFIRGKEIDLNNKQTDLHKRFKEKYNRK
jgi:imidazolonepropionase-like amidohydrolase